MLNLHNPYVIHLHEIIEDPGEKFIYIILHLYPGGDIKGVIEEGRKKCKEEGMNEMTQENKTKWMKVWGDQVHIDEIQEWSRQLMSALYTCHKKAKILHRDIKPENLMLDSYGRMILVDFGEAQFFVDDNDEIEGKSRNKGTPFYLAPESFRTKGPYHDKNKTQKEQITWK